MRYKDMAGSNRRGFPFKHCFALLKNLDKWKLRDEETAPKKAAMNKMDDDDEEEQGRNDGKPEGNKKAKERMKMEAEASSLRDKINQMIKNKETLTTKTLEAKIIITDKKKEIKIAKLQAQREDAKRKAQLDDRMVKLKEAKAWKEIMAEEKEHKMMPTKDMDEDQLNWWKETKAEIMKRKKLLRSLSSTPRGDGGDTVA